MAPQHGSTFYSIQYLRFVAAFMVVLVHASHSLVTYLGSDRIPVLWAGGNGVDIFFVISGFIMVMIGRTTRRSGWEFFWLRFTRIAPPYWIVTTVMVATIFAVPQLLQASAADPAHIIASYLFIPWHHPAAEIQPVLHVGWTLNLEFIFYSIFAALLWVGTRWRGPAIVGVLAALTALGYVFEPYAAIPAVWTASLLMEFAFGVMVGYAYFAGLRMPAWAGLALLVGGFTMILQQDLMSGVYDRQRWIQSGIPATAIVLGALMLERAGRVGQNQFWRFMGDISFSLYLCHYFAIGFLRAVWPDALMGNLAMDILFLTVTAIVSIAGSAAFYVILERPLVRIAQNRVKAYFRRDRASALPAE